MNERILGTARSWRVATAALMVLVCAAPALAQVQRQPRAYRGLFGGSEGDPASRQWLNVTFSVNGGYDDNATAGDGSGSGNPQFQKASTFLGGGAGLNYGRRWDRATLSASASVSTRYYQDIPELKTSTSYGGGIGLGVNLGPRTSLSVMQSVSYSPYYQFGFLPSPFLPGPGQVVAPNPDLVLDRREALAYSTSASLSRRLSRRGTMSLTYGYTNTDYTDDSLGKWAAHYASTSYSHVLTQGVSLRLGYGYRRAAYGTAQSAATARGVHNIDAGVDYAKSLSFSRKTTLSFSTGSSMLRDFDSQGTQRTYYRLVGNAALNHQIGQSWTAALGYSRGFGFADGFAEPYFSDTVVASLNGYWGNRTSMGVSASWSNGQIGLSTGNGYGTYVLSGDLEYALSRYVSLSTQAFFYRYAFDVPPSPLFPAATDRVGIRGGISFWLPLLR